MTPPIVDTGPLVAFLSQDDSAHAWAVTVFKQLGAPLVTCDVVIAEAHYLLSRTRNGADGLLALLETGGLQLASLAELDPALLRQLIFRYRDVPMDLADACIVRLSELHPGSAVVTIDQDFLVYRRNRRQSIPLICPPAK